MPSGPEEMWRLTIATPHDTCSLYLPEAVALGEIEAWRAYSERMVEAAQNAGVLIDGETPDGEGDLVRVVRGWWEPDVKDGEPRRVLKTVMAYRFTDLVGLSAQAMGWTLEISTNE